MKSILNCTFKEFLNILFKIMFIALFIILLITSCILKNKIDKAEKYINKLEQDFSEYIDTTSGTDEFSNYYNWK